MLHLASNIIQAEHGKLSAMLRSIVLQLVAAIDANRNL